MQRPVVAVVVGEKVKEESQGAGRVNGVGADSIRQLVQDWCKSRSEQREYGDPAEEEPCRPGQIGEEQCVGREVGDQDGVDKQKVRRGQPVLGQAHVADLKRSLLSLQV